MYEAGETTYLDILLSSSNIIDFISNYYIIGQIIESDTELLKQIEQEKNEVEKIKNDLDEKKASLKVKKAKKEQLAVITQNNKTLKEQAVANLTQEEQELQQKVEEYKAEEERIEALIKIATGEYEYTGDYTGRSNGMACCQKWYIYNIRLWNERTSNTRCNKKTYRNRYRKCRFWSTSYSSS